MHQQLMAIAMGSIYHRGTFEVIMWTSDSKWTVRVIYYAKVVGGEINNMYIFSQYTKYTSISCILRNVELVKHFSGSCFIAYYLVHTRLTIPWQTCPMERHTDCRINEHDSAVRIRTRVLFEKSPYCSNHRNTAHHIITILKSKMSSIISI